MYLTYSIGFIEADISGGLNEVKDFEYDEMSKTDQVQMRKFGKNDIILHPCE